MTRNKNKLFLSNFCQNKNFRDFTISESLILLELPIRVEPDLILTMNALLSKTFPILRHAALLRCSRISYAPLLGSRLPCIARFLLRRLCPAERFTLRIEVSICIRARSTQKEIPPDFRRRYFFLELPIRVEPDLILTMNALLSKTFPILRHAALLRCSRISYAPLLGSRLPCIARFLLRRLCPAERFTLRIEVSICIRARSTQKEIPPDFRRRYFFLELPIRVELMTSGCI